MNSERGPHWPLMYICEPKIDSHYQLIDSFSPQLEIPLRKASYHWKFVQNCGTIREQCWVFWVMTPPFMHTRTKPQDSLSHEWGVQREGNKPCSTSTRVSVTSDAGSAFRKPWDTLGSRKPKHQQAPRIEQEKKVSCVEKPSAGVTSPWSPLCLHPF